MTEARGADDRARGCLLGLACGDAVGTTLEFRRRGSFEPIDDMVGGGPFGLQPGQWTDDTSMALCLGESLLAVGFDTADQMQRYVRWCDEGYLSSTGECFDIGGTVAGALARFQNDGEPFAGSTDPRSAGNGSIMRLAPVVLYYAPDAERAVHQAGESSRTTHGCDEAVDACRLLARLLVMALAGGSRDEVLAAGRGLARHGGRALAPGIHGIAERDWESADASGIRGTGYVVESLEAAVWCFATTGSYRDAVLRAANLGDDADTTAAVVGQIAGAYYGEAGIPAGWREKVWMGTRIGEMAVGLWRARERRIAGR